LSSSPSPNRSSPCNHDVRRVSHWPHACMHACPHSTTSAVVVDRRRGRPWIRRRGSTSARVTRRFIPFTQSCSLCSNPRGRSAAVHSVQTRRSHTGLALSAWSAGGTSRMEVRAGVVLLGVHGWVQEHCYHEHGTPARACARMGKHGSTVTMHAVHHQKTSLHCTPLIGHGHSMALMP
jgi:hypothetical protein